MSEYNATFIKKTVVIPLTAEQIKAFDDMTRATGIKKNFYVRKILTEALTKGGWLPAESTAHQGKGHDRT